MGQRSTLWPKRRALIGVTPLGFSPLAFLDPEIILAFVQGRGPVDVTIGELREVATTTPDWSAQRKALGL